MIDALVSRLEAANTAYRAGNPIMSDGEYDALEAQLAAIDPNHPLLKKLSDDDDFEKVTRADLRTAAYAEQYGANVRADEVSVFGQEQDLTIPMGSQQKALSLDDPNLARFVRESGDDEHFWSDKVDGMSAEATYIKGELVRVLTRGDGNIGVNITAIARRIPELPKTVPVTDRTVVVRGEICMLKSQFPVINAALVAAGRDPIANTRNGTVGIIKTLKNQDYAKYLSFLAFNLLIV